MFKRIIAPLALLLALSGTMLAIAPVQPPAAMRAAVSQPMQLVAFSDCHLGHGCIFVDTNGGGAMYDVVFSVVGGNACWNFGTTFNNKMSSSIETIGGWHFKFYDQAGCNGAAWWTQPDDTEANWGSFPFLGHNDLASSFMLIQ